MKLSLPALALAGLTAAAPVPAQEAPPDAARLEAMTCREFLALDAAGQATVKAAMQAHASGEPPPGAPLPAPPAGGAASARVVEDRTGAAEGPDAAGTEMAAAPGGAAAPGVAGGQNESGKVAPDGTEASVTDEGGDLRLLAMRTSCEGGPDALALTALRAAFGNSL